MLCCERCCKREYVWHAYWRLQCWCVLSVWVFPWRCVSGHISPINTFLHWGNFIMGWADFFLFVFLLLLTLCGECTVPILKSFHLFRSKCFISSHCQGPQCNTNPSGPWYPLHEGWAYSAFPPVSSLPRTLQLRSWILQTSFK